MKAVILSGGKGTRLRPLTYAIPKPLLPVGRKPILEIIIERLKVCGFRNIILSVDYKKELIEVYFRDGSSFEVSIQYVEEPGPSGTAGPLRLAQHLLHEPFLVMNGDLLTELDFRKMYHFHIDKGAELTVGTVQHKIRLPYGLMDIRDGKVAGVEEKPELSFCVNAGIYIMSPSALDVIPEGQFFNMTDAIDKLANEGRKVLNYPITEAWRDIGHMRDYEEANADIQE